MKRCNICQSNAGKGVIFVYQMREKNSILCDCYFTSLKNDSYFVMFGVNRPFSFNKFKFNHCMHVKTICLKKTSIPE